ncbi:MAG: transposase [Desulfobulbaceae bacterium]|nr:transposase [Desulfobulbaceae bacterium]
MARGFIKGDRDQMFLLPPSVDDWVSKDHPVRFVQTCLEQMNLQSFYESYASEGRPPYDPSTMLGILVYAYSNGMRSSRKISKACEDEIPFRWISGNIAPDHRAICRFRARHEKEFKTLFNETLRLCSESGLFNLGKIFLDGTKVKANAALSANHTLDHINKILEEANAVDKAEDEKFGESERGDRLPKELTDPKERIKRIKAAKERLDQELKQKQNEQAEKVKEHKASGPKRGRKPKSPDDIKIKKKANITDPESRIMKNRSGFVQAYNCQAACSEDQIIVSADVTQDENDLYQLEPMLEQTTSTLRDSGVDENVEALAADAGYFREDLAIGDIEKDGPVLLVCTKKSHKLRKELKEKGAPRGRIPKDISNRDRMDRRLLTKKGYAIYKKRSYTIEPVFGQIKQCLNMDRFLRRGLKAVTSEWILACSISNLMKLFRKAAMA